MKFFPIALALSLACVAAGPETEKSKTMGNTAAPIRMDVYSDFTCPHCKYLHEQILPQIIRDYVSTGKGYIVFRDYVLTGQGHEQSRPAATFACCRYSRSLRLRSGRSRPPCTPTIDR